MAAPDPNPLLRRAEACYRKAGLLDDACRCLERLGDFTAAASLHEEAGRTADAAACFERAGAWTQAARCHEAAGADEAAVRCLLSAGRPLEAAWLYADRLNRPERARALLAQATAGTPAEALTAALVQARCQIATQPRAAAGAVRRLSVQAAGLPPGLWRDPLVARLFALAELLARPDLVAGLHAATVADAPTPAEAAAAAARWEAWASARLGAVDGIPTADLTGAATAEPPLEPPAPST